MCKCTILFISSRFSSVALVMQIYKHKPKKHYQRKTGHRQPLSKFLVTKIASE